MIVVLALATLWLGIGVLLTVGTRSRGWHADAVFLVLWPVHVVAHLLGRDRW